MDVSTLVHNPSPHTRRRAVMLRKLFRELWQRRIALLALIAVMTIGIGGFVGLASIHRDLDTARAAFYAEERLADFTVSLKRAPPYAVQDLLELPNVAEVRGRVNYPVRVDLPGVPLPILGTAISMPRRPRPVLSDIRLQTGAWFSPDGRDEVILDHAFAAARDLQPGDRLPVLLPDKQHDMLVVGTARSPEFVFVLPPGGGFAPDPGRYAVMYMPESDLQESADLEGAWNEVLGRVHDRSDDAMERTLDLISQRLDAYGVVEATPAEDMMSVSLLEDELTQLEASSKQVPVLFLIVAALVLGIMLGRVVNQERTAIGTLKAMGFSTGRLIRHYLGFALLVGSVAALGGVLFGLWVQQQMAVLYRPFFALPEIRAHFYADRVAAGVGISLLCALGGALRPVLRASRLAPAEAIRPPTPEFTKRILPERIGFFWRRLSFRWRLVLRSIFRNPLRSGVAVGASLVGTAIVLATMSMLTTFEAVMDKELKEIARYDVMVTLSDPRESDAVQEVAQLRGVHYAEGRLQVAADLRNGPYEERVSVTALPHDARLYRPVDANDQPVMIPPEGLLLSDALAEKLNAAPGDRIHLRPLIGARRTTEALVVGTVEAYMGLPAYGSIEYMSRLLGERWVANEILLLQPPGRKDGAMLDALRPRPEVIGVNRRLDALERLQETMGESQTIAIWMTVFFGGLLAFASLLNNSLVSVSEREREVGTLRVLGYFPGQIYRLFAMESLLQAGVGILLGLPAGVWMAHQLLENVSTDLYRFPATVTPGHMLLTAVLMAGFVLSAEVIVAWHIRRVKWLEAMKTRE